MPPLRPALRGARPADAVVTPDAPDLGPQRFHPRGRRGPAPSCRKTTPQTAPPPPTPPLAVVATDTVDTVAAGGVAVAVVVVVLASSGCGGGCRSLRDAASSSGQCAAERFRLRSPSASTFAYTAATPHAFATCGAARRALELWPALEPLLRARWPSNVTGASLGYSAWGPQR